MVVGFFYNLYNYFFTKDERFYYLSLIHSEDKWHIHGLWPQYSETSYPKFCKNIPFNITNLEHIIDQLHENWYSTCTKDEQFWKHEWDKHGTCMFNFNQKEFGKYELNYFSKALYLFDKAKKLNKIEKYSKDNKCMIPLNLDFSFR